MPVHSLHVFDRKGKALFTKRYVKESEEPDPDQLKLVFGMLYSLREVSASLSGHEGGGLGPDGGLHSVRTGASTLYNYETASGLRFAMYVTAESTNPIFATPIRKSLAHVYHELWIKSVTRSPLYRPTQPNVPATNFEQAVEAYFGTQPWFR